jgi:hypothetical protein
VHGEVKSGLKYDKPASIADEAIMRAASQFALPSPRSLPLRGESFVIGCYPALAEPKVTKGFGVHFARLRAKTIRSESLKALAGLNQFRAGERLGMGSGPAPWSRGFAFK